MRVIGTSRESRIGMLLGASVLPAGSSGSMCELTVYRYEPVRTYNAASFFFVLGASDHLEVEVKAQRKTGST